jgi:hypothetical protein
MSVGVTGNMGWIAASCITAFGGFTALALAMDRHFEDYYGRGKAPGPGWRHALRGAGTVALVLSLLASLASHGRSQGWVLWLGVLTAAALAVVVVLSYVLRQNKARH